MSSLKFIAEHKERLELNNNMIYQISILTQLIKDYVVAKKKKLMSGNVEQLKN